MQNIGRASCELAWTLLNQEVSYGVSKRRTCFSEMEQVRRLYVSMELVQCEPNLRCTLSLILK